SFVLLIVSPPPHSYSLSLPDALPICGRYRRGIEQLVRAGRRQRRRLVAVDPPALQLAARQDQLERAQLAIHPGLHGELEAPAVRSEEHTSELQSRENLVCRLLLEKKK